MSKRNVELLKELSQLDGISGYEAEVRDYLKHEYESLGYETKKDNIGSIYAYKKSKVKDPFVVMLDAHMDEVGFLASKINNNGLIQVIAVGGINPSILPSSRAIMTCGKKKFYGAIDSTPPHLLKEGSEKLNITDVLFDFGFSSKEDAISQGVDLPCMIVLEGTFHQLSEKRVLGKAFDDRLGIAVGLEVLQDLKDVDLPFDLYVGGSVQEEVGGYGASTFTSLIKPDFAFVIDCSPARDSQGDPTALGQLGKGVLIRYFDRSMVAQPKLLDFQKETLAENKIPYQIFNSTGGTNAGSIFSKFGGILTLTNCICARSIHTPSTILDLDDYNNCIKAIEAMIKKLDKNKLEELRP